MLESITELVVRIADLAEAEGRLLREKVIRSATGIGLIIVAVGAVIAGLCLIFAAIYIFTAERAGSAAAAALTGVLAIGTGGLLAWLGRKMAA